MSRFLPTLGPQLPRQGGPLSGFLGRTMLRSLRWGFRGELPDVARAVIIVAPHTSNWDFVVGIATRLALRIRVHWLGKHTLFKGLFGKLMRVLGGIPVNRSASHGAVEQVVREFARHEQFVIGLSPEGTRKKVHRWKSGFYYIALNAKVPILPIAFDYASRRLLIGSLLHPSGDFEADLEKLKTFFAQATPRHPDKA